MAYNVSNIEMLENLPFNLEAEQSVLGALLLDVSKLGEALEYIRGECFYKQVHKEIFNAIFSMFSSGKTIDFITILDEVINHGIFETPQDAKLYLANLMEIVPTTSNLEIYYKIIQDKFYVRALILAAQNIIDNANDTSNDAKTLLDFAEQSIYDIRQGRGSTGLVKIDEVIIEAYDKLQKLSSEDNSKYLGITTGFKSLDLLISGLNKSDLVLVAARPGMGKTSFALNLAANAAKKSGTQVVIFSLEMSNDQLVSRMLSSEALVDAKNLKTGNLTPDEWVQLASGAEMLTNMEIYLDDSANINVAEMKSKLRRLKNLGLVVIDYLQLMTSGRRIENRVQEVSEITRNLKIMAKELNVPVVCLSQLSRGPESRADKRPMLSDLRESGSIEQDADIVLFLYRDSYYNEESEEQNIADCIVAKNRHGEVDTVKLVWDGQFTRFSSLEKFKSE